MKFCEEDKNVKYLTKKGRSQQKKTHKHIQGVGFRFAKVIVCLTLF